MKTKTTIIFYLLVFVNSLFSQVSSEPKEYAKIKFIYEKKSNYYIDEKGVFADTLLFKIDFPKLKFFKHKNPNDSISICGLIPIKMFSETDLKKLKGIIYHTTENIVGEYNVKKNKTILKVKREDEDLKKTFKLYFKENYSTFYYQIKINYLKQTRDYIYPSVNYCENFNTQLKKITFFKNEKLKGNYEVKTDSLLFTNVVELGNDLNKKISPDVLFINNDFGILKITTLYDTIKLKSVVYE